MFGTLGILNLMQSMDAASRAMARRPGLDCKVSGRNDIHLGYFGSSIGLASLFSGGFRLMELHGNGISDSLMWGGHKWNWFHVAVTFQVFMLTWHTHCNWTYSIQLAERWQDNNSRSSSSAVSASMALCHTMFSSITVVIDQLLYVTLFVWIRCMIVTSHIWGEINPMLWILI